MLLCINKRRQAKAKAAPQAAAAARRFHVWPTLGAACLCAAAGGGRGHINTTRGSSAGMFDPHKIPSYFLPPSPDERKRRRSNRKSVSVSSSEEVEAEETVIGRTTSLPSPPSSPSFLFRNAVLLHVNPDSVAEDAGLYGDDDGGDRDGGFVRLGSLGQ